MSQGDGLEFEKPLKVFEETPPEHITNADHPWASLPNGGYDPDEWGR